MEWQLKTMADIAEPVNGIVDGPFGSNLKKSDYIDDSENGIPVLTTKNLHGDYSKDSVRYISKEKYEVIKRSTVYPGDILVAKIGSIGTCGIYPLSCKNALIPANLLKITVLPTVDRKYVYYYIQSKGFQEKIKAISTATAQPAFNVTKFRKLPIPTPLLPEQERIVARIEELFSQLDAGVETLKKTKAQLAVYRQAVLKEAFESVIPESDTCNVEDVCKDIKVGIVIKPAQYYTSADVGVRAFRSANVREFAVNDSDWVYLTKAGHEANLRSEIHTGDVLVVRSGYPGTACVVPPTYNGCNAIDILIAVPYAEKILPEYLCAYTNSPLGKRIIQEKKRGVAQAHFNVSGYSKTPIIVPCVETQKRVVAEIDSRLSVCDSIEQTVDTALQQAEAMRQSILKDAFEGRL